MQNSMWGNAGDRMLGQKKDIKRIVCLVCETKVDIENISPSVIKFQFVCGTYEMQMLSVNDTCILLTKISVPPHHQKKKSTPTKLSIGRTGTLLGPAKLLKNGKR